MYPFLKDHIPVGEYGRPATRPVCGASRAINGEMSECLFIILESVSHSMQSDEVISGEAMRALIDNLVNELKDQESPDWGMCMGSLDVKA